MILTIFHKYLNKIIELIPVLSFLITIPTITIQNYIKVFNFQVDVFKNLKYLYFSFILDDKDWLNGVRDQLDYREKVF